MEASHLITLLEQHVDWKKLSSISSEADGQAFRSQRTDSPKPMDGESAHDGLSAIIAYNAESFSFLYQENIDRFKSVKFFDPENEVPDFHHIDLLYLPGGYPEKHLDALAGNNACRNAIKSFAEQGGRIVAECGGMMYLCNRIVSDEGEFPMCGVLPYSITARKADRKLTLGYRSFELDGQVYRGHEFHYTQFLGEMPESIAQVYDAKGNPVSTPVFRYKNVLASYTHLYKIKDCQPL
jgi:cobyrinic acid a,c-diamide synthase